MSAWSRSCSPKLINVAMWPPKGLGIWLTKGFEGIHTLLHCGNLQLRISLAQREGSNNQREDWWKGLFMAELLLLLLFLLSYSSLWNQPGECSWFSFYKSYLKPLDERFYETLRWFTLNQTKDCVIASLGLTEGSPPLSALHQYHIPLFESVGFTVTNWEKTLWRRLLSMPKILDCVSGQ